MALTLPDSVKKILTDKAYGHVITYGPKGTAQVSMVWMDVDGDRALFNTSEGRVKPRNLRRDPRVIVSIQNREAPQSFLLLEGTATVSEQGAEARIDKLAQRFLGTENYPYRQPGEKRLNVHIDVTRIGGFAPGMKPWA